MNQAEFEALVEDASKRVIGELCWAEDEDHSPAVEFRVEVQSNPGYPIFIKGSYNRLAATTSYTLVHRGSGRIYALDIGKDHHNPDCQNTGEVHKHRWREQVRDKEAYAPDDICPSVRDPVAVWSKFCAEAKIQHQGSMRQPPPLQLEIL